MNIESLAGMLSQRIGADQSMGSSVMSVIIGFLVQKMMSGGYLLSLKNLGIGTCDWVTTRDITTRTAP